MHSRPIPWFHSSLIALLVLSGCAVGPDYRPPALPVAVPALAPSAATAPAALRPWWQRVDNPALTGWIEKALAGNRDLRIATARLQEAKALRRESRSAFMPAGSVSAGYRRQLDSTVFFQGVPRNYRDQDIFDLGIDAAWEVDLFGRIRRTVEASTALSGAAEAEWRQLRLLIATETARAYIELAAAQQAIPLQERQLTLARETLRLLQAQVGEGKIARDRLGAAEAGIAVAHDTLREVWLTERAARNRLGVLTGEGLLPASTTAAATVIPVPALPGDATAMLLQRPDVQAAERRLAASTAAIGIARADYFPTVGFVARVGAEATKLGNLDSADANTFAFGPRLSWDLLNLERTRARVQGAEARTQQALAAWENSVLLALEEIDNALARRREAAKRSGDWRRAAASADEAARIARLRHEQGLLGPVDAFAAEQAALQAKLAAIGAETELVNATLFLQQSLATDR